MKKILVIEDDADLFSLLKYNLEKEGFALTGLQTGKLRLLEANQMSSVFLLHLYATASSDPAVSKLRL